MSLRRILEKVDPHRLKDILVQWMQQQSPASVELLHLDGKVLKNAQPAPASPAAEAQAVAPEPCEIPPELQKPKADKALTLVNFITSGQQLIDQIAVPSNTNEEAAVAAHLPQMDLAGVCITADAAHTTKANARQLSQHNGA